MAKKLTLSMDEAVIEAAKKYAEEKGTSLSSMVENFFKSATGVNKKKKAIENPPTDTPIVDELERLINNRLSPEESKKSMEEYFRRKPYMKEYIEHLEKKHGIK